MVKDSWTNTDIFYCNKPYNINIYADIPSVVYSCSLLGLDHRQLLLLPLVIDLQVLWFFYGLVTPKQYIATPYNIAANIKKLPLLWMVAQVK